MTVEERDNRVQVRFSPELRERVQAFAARSDMSKAAVIKAAVHDYLAQRGY